MRQMADSIRIESVSVGRRRYGIMLLLFLTVTINYIGRANLAIAGPVMAKEFGWSLSLLGVAFSAIFWTYTPCLLGWGALLDVIGVRVACTIGLFIWASASVITGTINSFGALIGARWTLGVGQSIMPSASAKAVREWAPARERGWATGAFSAGYYAGPALGFPICAWLVAAAGWRAMFYLLGGFTFLFFFLWLFVYNRPERVKWLNNDEREKILAERNSPIQQAAAKGISMTRGHLLRHPSTWGLVIAQATATYTLYLFLTWLPAYLIRAQHLNLKQAGAYSSIPWVFATFAVIIVGWYSDNRLTSEARDRGARRIHVVISMIAACTLLLVPLFHSLGPIIALLAIAIAGSGCILTTNVALAHDLLVDPKFAGFLFGLVGVGSNILALLAPIITGVVAQFLGGFGGAFLVAGTLSVLGVVCVLALTRKPIAPPMTSKLPPTLSVALKG